MSADYTFALPDNEQFTPVRNLSDGDYSSDSYHSMKY